MTVTIYPFQWNFLTIETSQNFERLDLIADWFMQAFKEKSCQTKFKNAVHFISDPYKDGEITKVDTDLGSGLVEDFFNLLDALAKTGFNKIEIK